MAVEKHEIIYSIKLDVAGTTEGLNSFTQAATKATKASEDLKDVQNDNAEAAKRQETAAKKTKEAIQAEEGSIAALREANKKLTAERNATTTATEAGRAKIKQLNADLDKNNATIKENVDAYTKQKIGIGGYTDALDKMVPGLGATINGFKGMTKSAVEFLATPIGMVIGALGLALGALTAYFKGSEEGQDKLAKAMAIGKVVMQGVLVVVEKLGGFLMNALEFIGDIGLAMVNKVSPQIGEVLQQAIDAGAEIADLQDKIEADENDFIVRRAEVNNQVAQMREQALQLEGDAKRKMIQDAIDLEKSLAEAEVSHSKEKLKLIELDIKNSGDATEEQKKQRAEALADVINQEAAGYQATLRFQKEIEKLKDEEAKKDAERRKQRAEDEELERQGAIAKIERYYQNLKEKVTLYTKFEIDAATSLKEDMKKVEDDRATSFKTMHDSIAATIKKANEDQEKAAQIAKDTEGAKQDAWLASAGVLGALAGVVKKNSIAYKVLASGEIIISTAMGIAKALASAATPFIEPFATITRVASAATIGIHGAAALAKVNGVQFFEGGYTGKGNPRAESTTLGKKWYTYHKDEYITPSRVLNTPEGQYHVSRLERLRQRGRNSFSVGGFADGGFATQLATQQALGGIDLSNTNALLNEILNKPMQPVLILQDFEAVQDERNQVQTKANVL